MKNIILPLILFYSINLYSQNQIDREICIPDTKTYALNKVWVFSNSLVVRASDTFSIDSVIFYKIYLNNIYSGFSFSNDCQGTIYIVNEFGEKDTLIPNQEIPNFKHNIPGTTIIISNYHETLKTPLCEYTDLIAFKIDNYIEYYKKGIGIVAATASGKLEYYLTEIRYDK